MVTNIGIQPSIGSVTVYEPITDTKLINEFETHFGVNRNELV